MDTPPQGRLPLAVSVGSEWCWEPLKPHARQDVRIVETKWNGEEWWVKTEPIGKLPHGSDACWNELDRFVEACVLVHPGPGQA